MQRGRCSPARSPAIGGLGNQVVARTPAEALRDRRRIRCARFLPRQPRRLAGRLDRLRLAGCGMSMRKPEIADALVHDLGLLFERLGGGRILLQLGH